MDPVTTVGTVVELAPEVIELIQQIIENQGNDLNAENLTAIVNALYCEIEDENGLPITVSVADMAHLQLQQTKELNEKLSTVYTVDGKEVAVGISEQLAMSNKMHDAEFNALNDGIGVICAGLACIFVWKFFTHIFGGIFNV